MDFGTRPVKRKTLQAEKRREDAAELSEVALQSSGLWQAPTQGRNPAPLEFRTFDWQVAAAAVAAVAAYLAWPSDLGGCRARVRCNMLSLSKKVLCGSLSLSLAQVFRLENEDLCSSFDFGSFCQPWTLVEKPLPLNRGRCIKVLGRYWCLRSCPRSCKHLLWPRPQVLSNHFGPQVGRYSYHRMLRLLWWWDLVSIEDGDDSVMTITTQWWPSLWSMLDVEWAADYGDYGDYSDYNWCTVPRNTQASFTSTSAPALLAKLMSIFQQFGPFRSGKMDQHAWFWHIIYVYIYIYNIIYILYYIYIYYYIYIIIYNIHIIHIHV